MSEKKKWIFTEDPTIMFEDNAVGHLKKELWDMSMDEIDKVLEEYGIPSESELGKAGCYIQNTSRNKITRELPLNLWPRNRRVFYWPVISMPGTQMPTPLKKFQMGCGE